MDPEEKGFAEQTGRDTGRTAHGKPKCRQGHAISGSRVAPPEKEEGPRLNWTVTSRRRYGGADSGPAGKAGTTRSNTGRKKKRTMKQGRALRGSRWPLESKGSEDALDVGDLPR